MSPITSRAPGATAQSKPVVEIVDHDHAFAGVDQRVDHLAADVAGTAGDQDRHGKHLMPVGQLISPAEMKIRLVAVSNGIRWALPEHGAPPLFHTPRNSGRLCLDRHLGGGLRLLCDGVCPVCVLSSTGGFGTRAMAWREDHALGPEGHLRMSKRPKSGRPAAKSRLAAIRTAIRRRRPDEERRRHESVAKARPPHRLGNSSAQAGIAGGTRTAGCHRRST